MITVEVNKQQEEKKNIFFQGNIVVADNGQVVLVVGDGDYDSVFSGVTIESPYGEYKGYYTTSYAKEAFTQFTGTITITSK